MPERESHKYSTTHLTWAHTTDPFETRDALYRARDAEVLRRALDDDLIASEKDLRLASRVIHDVNQSGATLREFSPSPAIFLKILTRKTFRSL